MVDVKYESVKRSGRSLFAYVNDDKFDLNMKNVHRSHEDFVIYCADYKIFDVL